MIKILLIFTFGTAFCSSFAQQSVIDSLNIILSRHSKDDTVKLNILNEIVYAYHTINPDKGLEVADKAIQLAATLHIPAKLAGSYANKGVNYWAKGNDSLALEMYNKALSIHTASGNKSSMAKMYNNIGLLYFNKSLYYKAIEYHQKSVDMFILLKDTTRLPAVLNNIGVDYQYLADYPKALDYYLQALAIYEHAGRAHPLSNSIADTYGNLGLVYNHLHKYNTSLEYHQKALTMYEKANNQLGVAAVNGNIGIVFDNLLQPEKAISYYQKALAINEVLGNQRRIASDLGNIAVSYIALNNYPKAFPYLQRTLAIYKDADDKNGVSLTLGGIGEILLHAPASFLLKQHINPADRYKIAEEYQQNALEIAKEIGALNRQVEILQNLGNLYETTGNSNKALAFYKQYQVLKDSILNEEIQADIAKKVAAFEFDKKEALLKAAHDKEFALANAEINKQRLMRNVVIAGIIGLLAAAFFGYRLYKRKRDAEQLRKEVEFKMQVTDVEMKALRSQMNPHFIFNSLNSIRNYNAQNNTRLADEYLVRFSMLMRQVFENAEYKKVPIEDDLHALELYMQMEAARLNHKFNYQINIAPDIDKENTMIPPLLLQPFVENSIWHGITPKEGNGNIKVDISRQSKMICCTVEDDGVGFKNNNIEECFEEKDKPSGIFITKTRINLMNKAQNANASLHMYPLNNGTKVEINLPLELNF